MPPSSSPHTVQAQGASTKPRSKHRWVVAGVVFALAVLAVGVWNDGPPDDEGHAPAVRPTATTVVSTTTTSEAR
jgi:hypothetical protein